MFVFNGSWLVIGTFLPQVLDAPQRVYGGVREAVGAADGLASVYQGLGGQQARIVGPGASAGADCLQVCK